MNKKSTGLLKVADFTQLVNWSTYTLLSKDLIYTQKYPFVRIGDLLKRNKEVVNVQDDIIYKRATIRINGKGITLRDSVQGKMIGTKKQFKIHSGQFLLSKIDARNGAFGVVPNELEGGIITGNFWAFDVDYSKINPHYLTILTGTKEFQTLSQSASVGTTNRNYLQEDQFLGFHIPLPTIDQQQEIVSSFNLDIANARAYEDAANQLEISIGQYLFKELSIKQFEEQPNPRALNYTDFQSIERWGYDFNFSKSKTSILHSLRFENVKLKTLIEINPPTLFPKKEIEISFIPMESVSEIEGTITEFRTRSISECKGYTKFKEGDLIWARITPCMENGKSAIASGLKNGFGCGSTEFHVLRNHSQTIDIRYIHILLRIPFVLENAKLHFTGSAGQQRVPKSFLENLEIPVPPLNKQQEIITNIFTIKNKIKAYISKAKEFRYQAEFDFEKAIFK